MASYQKPKNIKPNQAESAEHLVNKLDKNATRAEQFLEKNKRPFTIGICAVVVLFLGFWGYHTWISTPSKAEATEELAFAQKAYEMDSLQLALNGTPANLGLIKIADQFSSTPAGNIAKYLAGAAYYKLGQYENAISYFKKYNGEDEITAAEVLGLIGDCYAQQDNAEDALTYYVKAANERDNDFTTPFYLLKAGNVAMYLKKYSSAAKYYQKIKDSYPKSAQAATIDKYIAAASGAAKNL
ncbi:MAG: tetratricopeptide repeat protein [Flavobacteriales bacterium]|nr:tetratricopeptide repeat protein [Flavobacteriales bacterium]